MRYLKIFEDFKKPIGRIVLTGVTGSDDLQGNFIKEWKSMTEVAEYYKVTLGSINNAVYGHSKSSCGFKWKIKE